MTLILRQHYHKGQALPEMVIVFPLVVILVMTILQISLMYRGKATLNNATLLAARSGSINHGYLHPMQKIFINRMAALGQMKPSLKKNTTTTGLFKSPNQMNLLATQKAVGLSHNYQSIEITWPTKAVFNHFAIRFKPLVSCKENDCPFSDIGGAFRFANKSIYQIPLGNQNARNQSLQEIDGGRVDLQDANLLRIQSRYCYDLEVPVANFIIWRTLEVAQGGDPDWQVCQKVSDVYGENRFLIPLRGHSIVRMQSGFRCEGDEENGIDCKNM